MFMILIALQFSLILYHDINAEDTTVWNFIVNLDQWNWSSFIIVLGGLAAAAALVGISAGGAFRFVTDFLVMGPAIAGLASIGVVFINFGNVIRDELIGRFFVGCGGAVSCAPANILTGVIIGPLAFLYAWTVMEWWRGKDV